MNKEDRTSFPSMAVSHWWKLRNQFKQHIPGVVTKSYLSSVLNVKESTARQCVLPELRALGFVDEQGKISRRLVARWRQDSHYPLVCAEIKNSIYPDELTRDVSSPLKDRKAVTRWFARTTGSGTSRVKKMVSFYTLLCAADPGQGQPGQDEKSVQSQKGKDQVPGKTYGGGKREWTMPEKEGARGNREETRPARPRGGAKRKVTLPSKAGNRATKKATVPARPRGRATTGVTVPPGTRGGAKKEKAVRAGSPRGRRVEERAPEKAARSDKREPDVPARPPVPAGTESTEPERSSKESLKTSSGFLSVSLSGPDQPVGEGTGLQVNVQVHISADVSPNQIDQIFKSMADHILKRRDTRDEKSR